MDSVTVKQIEDTLTALLSKQLEDFKGGLDEAIDARFKSFMDEQFKAGSPVPLGQKSENKYEAIGKYIKAVFRRDAQAIAKGMTEGQDSAGGFTVPVEMNNEIMRLAGEYGLVFKHARRFPMKSDTLDIPTSATSVTSYWKDEAGAGTESTPSFGNAQLNAKTLIGLTVTSNELLEDASPDIVAFLLELFAEEFARNVDNQAFNGSGSPFVGILNSNSGATFVTMATGKDTFAEVTLPEIRRLISAVPTSALPTSAFFMSPTVWGIVQSLQEGSQTVAAFQAQLLNVGVGADQVGVNRPHGMLWGYPVYLSDTMVSTTAVSTAFIAFGSMSKGLFWGDRKQATMKISEDASIASANMFENNQSAVRIVQRVALKLALPTAFAVLKTAAE